MHPIEQLRMVARATGEDPALVAQEAAAVLAACAAEPAGLVTACRRLVDHQPSSGPIWWLAARVLAAADPASEAWRAAEELDDDQTPAALATHLPDDVTVTVLGWPDQAVQALRRRGDVTVLVVDTGGVGAGAASSLRRAGTDAYPVAESGLGPAAASSDLVLLEALALAPAGFVAVSGSRAGAAVAQQAGVPVWVVAGAGRTLPAPLWQAMAQRLSAGSEPWERAAEIVPLALADRIVGPDGLDTPEDAAGRAGCPPVPELTRTWFTPGSRRTGGAGPHPG